MGSPLKEPKLLLNEFQVLYKVLKRGLPPWASFLLLGFLVWVEETVHPAASDCDC
jgi:hypothetical protein